MVSHPRWLQGVARPATESLSPCGRGPSTSSGGTREAGRVRGLLPATRSGSNPSPSHCAARKPRLLPLGYDDAVFPEYRLARQAQVTHPFAARQDDRQWLHRGGGALRRGEGRRAARPVRSLADRYRDALVALLAAPLLEL